MKFQNSLVSLAFGSNFIWLIICDNLSEKAETTVKNEVNSTLPFIPWQPSFGEIPNIMIPNMTILELQYNASRHFYETSSTTENWDSTTADIRPINPAIFGVRELENQLEAPAYLNPIAKLPCVLYNESWIDIGLLKKDRTETPITNTDEEINNAWNIIKEEKYNDLDEKCLPLYEIPEKYLDDELETN